MDSMWVSGTYDPGSIPGEATIKNQVRPDALFSYRDVYQVKLLLKNGF